MDYRQVEGVLFGMSRRVEPRYSRPVLAPRSGVAGPGQLPFRSAQRVDVTIAARTLSVADRRLVTEHYLLGIAHPRRDVRRVVKKLVVALADD